jgi:hypothetical protein
MTEVRKIAAILAADVVGYSRLAGADEDRTLAHRRCRARQGTRADAHSSRIEPSANSAALTGPYWILSICASLSPRMKSGSGMNPTGLRYLSLLPPVAEIAHRKKARTALAVAASGCDFDTTAYS